MTRVCADLVRVCLLLVALTGLASCNRTPPSIILVTVSGLRADEAVAAHMPKLAAMKQEGAFRDDALVTSPATIPGLMSVMTGASAERFGAVFDDQARLPADLATIAERLHARQFEARAYVGEGNVSTLTGLARGFDTFVTPSLPAQSAMAVDEPERAAPWRGGLVPAAQVLDQFSSFLRSRPNRNPLFAWLHFGDLEALDPADTVASYHARAAELDKVLGLLRSSIDSYGLSGRTTLVIASLGGMALGERGEIRHGLTLSKPVVEVPVVVVGAGKGETVPAGLAGLHALVLRLAGERDGGAGAGELAVTRLPERLYGWPSAALARSAGREFTCPGTAPPADVAALFQRAGCDPASGPATDAPAVLNAMAEAYAAMAEGRVDAAVSALGRASTLAPRGITPRVALLQVHPPPAGSPAAATLEADLVALAGDMTARRLDVARALVEGPWRAHGLELLQALDTAHLSPGEKIAAAEVYAAAQAPDAAAALVGQLLETEKDAPELLEWQGDLFLSSGNAYRARAAYEKALQSPRAKSANLAAKLADALAQLGEKDAALQRLAEALQLDPGYRYPHARAAAILLEQGKEKAAADAVAKSIRASGDEVQDALARARALERLGLLPAAAGEIQEVMEKHAGDPFLEVGVARLALAAGKADDARRRLLALLEARPGMAQAWVELARVEATAGDETKAVAALDKAEASAGPAVTITVRRDPAFRKFGAGSALARRADAFDGRGAPKQGRER